MYGKFDLRIIFMISLLSVHCSNRMYSRMYVTEVPCYGQSQDANKVDNKDPKFLPKFFDCLKLKDSWTYQWTRFMLRYTSI